MSNKVYYVNQGSKKYDALMAKLGSNVLKIHSACPKTSNGFAPVVTKRMAGRKEHEYTWEPISVFYNNTGEKIGEVFELLNEKPI